MKEQIYLHIPQPCHEDWDKMTPVDRGKFCGSCAKQVVDFTCMSDQQVLNYFKNTNGKTCGRFAEDQLQRALQPVIPQKKKAWWIAAMMPLLLLFEKSNAQKRNLNNNNTSVTVKEPRPEIMGKVARPEICGVKKDTLARNESQEILVGMVAIADNNFINGRIVDEEGKPVEFASVQDVNENYFAETNSSGLFKIKTRNKNDSAVLKFSAMGYETKEIKINNDGIDKVIILSKKINELYPVVVNTPYSIKGSVGLTFCVRHIRSRDTLIQKIFKSESFKVFPNPIQRGSDLKIDVKNEGTYSIQVFDNSSKLLLVKDFTAIKGATITSVDIPSSYAGGIYYVRLVDEKKKKQYTDKIIIQ